MLNDEQKQKRKDYYQSHKEEYRKRRKKYESDGRAYKWQKKWVESNGREKYRYHQNKSHKNLRDKIIISLGGKCVICGESNTRWLHTDRIRGGRHSNSPYWVIKHLDEFQLLCANHHNEKTIYGEIL